MIQISAFVGYQINSVYHSSAVFKKMIASLNEQLESSTPPIRLNATFGEFPTGSNLWNEITAALGKADVTIFDVSENNPNVMVEAGLALGGGKHVVLLKHKKSMSTHRLPTDVNAFVYKPYANEAALVNVPFIQDIANSILHYVNESHTEDYYLKSLWSLKADAPTLVIPGALPEKETGNRFGDYIRLRKYSDLDALIIVIETLNHLYPRMKVSWESYKKISSLPKDWRSQNIVLIGGTSYNKIVRQIDSGCPIEYKEKNRTVWLRHKVSGKEWRPRFSGKGIWRRATDYGFIYKRDLSAAGNKLVMLGGARTWGVCGAAEFLGFSQTTKDSESRRSAKAVIHRFGSDPSLLIPVEVEGTRDGIVRMGWDIDSMERL